ncbi:hypothetical protein VTK73DRAFT_9545 [Phialemonium thermophilum]|uniref:Uncharacterized protein n=1 Tax=Phialemonium thermophilum TaxID=223376 RepID=A0ABR3W1Y8_9PEZI
MVKLLLEAGVDLHSRNNESDTPLALTTDGIVGDIHPPSLFLDCDYNKPAKSWLWAMITTEFDDLVRLATEPEADVNSRDRMGKTRFHLSVWRESQAVARRLPAAGAEIYYKNNDGDTPLALAGGSSVGDVTKDLDFHNETFMDKVLALVESVSQKTVRLLDEALDPLEEALDPLEEAVGLLDKAGYDVNSTNEHGDTGLGSAASETRVNLQQMIRMLSYWKDELANLGGGNSTETLHSQYAQPA